MILSGQDIQSRLGKDIVIDPFDPSRLSPNSYNLTLHDPHIQICQITYWEISGDSPEEVSEKYQNSNDIQPSLMHRELGFDDRDTQLELGFDEAIRSTS